MRKDRNPASCLPLEEAKENEEVQANVNVPAARGQRIDATKSLDSLTGVLSSTKALVRLAAKSRLNLSTKPLIFVY